MGKCVRIMVVDDDYNMRALVSRVLELEDYEVIQATDGNSALALLEERRPDLVILDVMMPGLNGFQILFLIKKRYNIPVIIVTAMSEASSYPDASDIGADGYLRKPFNLRDLVARVRARLGETAGE
ncbi:response regulator transcription factor [Chloroflexota bacterium]